MITNDELDNWFTCHSPMSEDQKIQCAWLCKEAKTLAYCIRDCTPPSADQTVAIRKLRECVMTAKAAIVCGIHDHVGS